MKNKEKSKQIGFRDLGMLIVRSKIPWGWVVVSFLFNLYYNRILFNLPVTTGRLLGGDLSYGALAEALTGYVLYAVCAVIQALVRAFSLSVTTRSARRQLWNRMLKINEAYFDKVNSGEMLSTVTYDVAYAMPTLVNLLVAVVPDIIYVVKALNMVNTYDTTLLLVLIAFLPMKYVYTVLIGRKVYKTEAAVRSTTGVLTSKIEERLQNVSLIKSFNREETESEAGADSIKKLYDADVAVARLGGISLTLEQAIELAQQFIMMVIAVILLQNGKIDISQWIAFFLFSNNLSTKFATLIEDWMSVKTISGSLDRTTKLYRAPVEDMNENGKPMENVEDDTLVLDNVSFCYGENKALSNVTFEIPHGQKVAIVGSCGSGKSTTLALLERFYNPTEGSITLGGTPISDFRMKDYRSRIAYVPQSHQVFTGTLREALLYGNNDENISDESILVAAKQTGFDGYITMQDEGLDAMLKNGGDMMSGGQLQKLLLTRENLRDCRIVLMDEPASALDAQSSQIVKKLILEDFKDKTVVVVTHDLTFVDEMDQIIMLDEGKLVDKGTYPAMLERCAEFRTLVENQSVEVTE